MRELLTKIGWVLGWSLFVGIILWILGGDLLPFRAWFTIALLAVLFVDKRVRDGASVATRILLAAVLLFFTWGGFGKFVGMTPKGAASRVGLSTWRAAWTNGPSVEFLATLGFLIVVGGLLFHAVARKKAWAWTLVLIPFFVIWLAASIKLGMPTFAKTVSTPKTWGSSADNFDGAAANLAKDVQVAVAEAWRPGFVLRKVLLAGADKPVIAFHAESLSRKYALWQAIVEDAPPGAEVVFENGSRAKLSELQAVLSGWIRYAGPAGKIVTVRLCPPDNPTCE